MPGKLLLNILLCIAVAIPLCTYGQKAQVTYVNAEQLIEQAKTSGKPYLWATVYVPKCLHGAELFKDRTAFYNKHKDKLELVSLSILYSESNVDTFASMSRIYGYDGPFYAIDTMYAKDDRSRTHFEFMNDLNKLLGAKEELFQHIILDKHGKVVYRTEDNIDFKKVEKLLK